MTLRSGDNSRLATIAEIKALLEGEEEDPQFKRKLRRLIMRRLKDEGGSDVGVEFEVGDAYLQEIGDFLLQENGDKLLIDF